jgi:hypothetical protein
MPVARLICWNDRYNFAGRTMIGALGVTSGDDTVTKAEREETEMSAGRLDRRGGSGAHW